MADTPPPTDPPADPSPPADPPPPPPDNTGDLNTKVDKLFQGLTELTASVAALAAKGAPDSTPTKVPWTHRRLF